MTRKEMEFSACTSILVGKKASLSGNVMIGRNEDCKAAWPKHTVIHPRTTNPAGSEFVSKANGFRLTLPEVAAKYTATPEWSDKFGVFEEAGINEYGVAMSATESAYANEQVLACDPLVTTGISEEAMVTVVLPYVTTARAAVKRLGAIVTAAGASEANGILFADQDEAWYMEIGSGHHWVAQRIPDDGYAVVANQLAIQTVDVTDEANFLTSPNITDFILNNHLNRALNPTTTTFNFRQIFGTQTQSDLIYSTPRVWDGQRRLTPSQTQEPMSFALPFICYPDQKISRNDVFGVLASHFNGTEYDPTTQNAAAHKFRPISLAKTQESHVLELVATTDAAVCGIHWLALGVTAESLFVPIFAGASDVIAAYKTGSSTYAPTSAYWQYKHLGVLVDAHWNAFNRDLTAMQTEAATHFNHLVNEVFATLPTLEQAKQTAYLTEQTKAAQTYGLDQVAKLTATLITTMTDFSPLNFTTDANL